MATNNTSYDFNINNYDINDVLNIFKITNIYSKDVLDNAKIMVNNISTDNATTNEQQLFFTQAYNILETHIFNIKHINIPTPIPIPIPNNIPISDTTSWNITKKTITKTLTIDSLFRDNYATTNASSFIYTLPFNLSNIVAMRIVSSEIPHSWYSFSDIDKSNTFTIILHNVVVIDSNGNSTYNKIQHNIIIPQGNYLSDELISVMNYIFVNLKNGLDMLYFNIEETTGKCIFRARDPNDIPNIPCPFNNTPENNYYSPEFYFELFFNIEDKPPYREASHNAGWNLGFNAHYYKVTDEYTYLAYHKLNSPMYHTYLESIAPYGRSAVSQYMFISIDDFNNNFNPDTLISKIKSSYMGNNIMARIVVDNGPNTIITSDNASFIKKQRDYFGPVNISKLNINLIDKYGKNVFLNDTDITIVLEFDIIA